ncbi:Glycine-rich RNA-binding protein [Triticum urartu]|uniref:Glycine-rich RNA-binding protein n=1 Tax=Triticum urartu TaxID=4572 RepID=M7ZLB1_TRIUA|nr:Glycine-rich RNA-binding protein [Triticum urartu]
MAETEYRCFVGGLAWATDDNNLQQAFSQYGEILDAKVTNRPTNPCLRSVPIRSNFASWGVDLARSGVFVWRI